MAKERNDRWASAHDVLLQLNWIAAHLSSVTGTAGQAEPRNRTFDLWRLDFAAGIPSRLTFHPSHDIFPLGSHDGRRIAFGSLREARPHLYELNADSAGTEKLLLKTDFPKTPSGFSSDGSLLFYDSINPQTGGDIWALPLVGPPEPYPVVRTAADEHYGTLSPDGRWLAYISNETGAYEVYAESFPATGFKRQVSTHGGFEPQWRSDGKELFYLAHRWNQSTAPEPM